MVTPDSTDGTTPIRPGSVGTPPSRYQTVAVPADAGALDSGAGHGVILGAGVVRIAERRYIGGWIRPERSRRKVREQLREPDGVHQPVNPVLGVFDGSTK